MSRKTGIVGGTGPEGSGLAARWAAAGEHIVIGSRDARRAAETAQLLRARFGSNAKIEGADVREWRRIAATLRNMIGPVGSAQCAIETALLDALTRYGHMPLWAFFGG